MNRLSKNRLAMIASLKLQNISSENALRIWIKYENRLDYVIKHNGKRYTLELYKDCYGFLRNYLLQIPTQPVPFCKTDKFGIPKPLWSLRPLIKRDRESKRLALTIARTYEKIRLEVDYSNLSSITDDYDKETYHNVRNIDKTFSQFLKLFVHKYPWYLGYLQKPIEPWSKVGTTLSTGPNGPAVACSHLDAKAVYNDKVLFNSLKIFNNAMKQNWITQWLIKQSKSFETEDNYLTGKLGFISENAGKTRIFAIGDYWSQLSLKPIQISLYRTLQSISTDSTKNQEQGFQSLVKESLGYRTYCFDLSSASDRIPAIMQKHRLELMTNQTIAESWLSIMTDRHFHIKSTGTNVKWKVCQPLGLLSSFPSFALWHHDIVQLSYNWENFHKGRPLRFFKQYRILGDDIVIFNTKVAKRYQWLLKQLGININLSKSIIGTSESSQIEFAKRLAKDGKEMSSIKYNILSKSDILSILDLVELLYKRDFISTDSGHYGLSNILKSEDLRRLQYMIWLRTSDEPTLKCRYTSLIFNREDIIRRIISKRAKNIIEKAMKIKPLDMEVELPYLSNGFSSISVPCNEKVLADRSIGSLKGSHPIVLALTQTSRELQFLMFTVLDDLDPETVSPVEYLPVVSSKSYFNDRKDVTRYLCKIILESFEEALDEKSIEKM